MDEKIFFFEVSNVRIKQNAHIREQEREKI